MLYWLWSAAFINILGVLYASVLVKMTYFTFQHLARRTLQLYPYRLILTHALTEYDKMVRVDGCQRLLEVITDDALIVYSDEANFRTDGTVNRWNCRIWDYNRPDDFVSEKSQSGKQTTVWAGISKDRLFGPYFFPSTVNGMPIVLSFLRYFIMNLWQVMKMWTTFSFSRTVRHRPLPQKPVFCFKNVLETR
jgi:hypothetical protein